MRRSPGNRTFLFNLAAAHLACRDGERAAAVLRAALDLDPQSAPLHASLAEAHVALGQTAAARRELELALRLDPRMARAWLRLAELAGPGALAVLRRAVAAEADSAKVWVELGKLEVRGRRPRRGGARLRRGLPRRAALGPGLAPARRAGGPRGPPRRGPPALPPRRRRRPPRRRDLPALGRPHRPPRRPPPGPRLPRARRRRSPPARRRRWRPAGCSGRWNKSESLLVIMARP